MEPEADKEIGAQADHLPENEGEKQVVRKDQPQHRKGKQRHKCVVAVVPGIVMCHVTQRIYLHHQANYRNDNRHDNR